MIKNYDAFNYAIEWLKDERDYTVAKFGTEADRTHVEEFANQNINDPSVDRSWWDLQLTNYFYRAKILGLDTPNGRQALAKFVSTALGMLTATVQVYGELPEPGVTSGENLDKLREL